jgi:hypothetical protein
MSWTIKVEPSGLDGLNKIMFPFERWKWMVFEDDHMPLFARTVNGYARTKEQAFARGEECIEEIVRDRALPPQMPNLEIRKYVPRSERDTQT